MWFMRPAIGWAQLPDPDRRLLPVRLRHPSRRLRHGRAGQAGGRPDPQGPRASRQGALDRGRCHGATRVASCGGDPVDLADAARRRCATAPTVRGRGPPAARGRVRARPAAGCRRSAARSCGGGDRGRAGRRRAARGGRRAGLVGARAGPRPRAVRPGDRRPVDLRARRLRGARPRRRRAAPRGTWSRACAASGSGRYAVTEPNAGSDARTLATTAVRDGDRLGPQRREVVRDRPGQHRLHDLPGPGRRGRRAAADAVPRRLRRARRCA